MRVGIDAYVLTTQFTGMGRYLVNLLREFPQAGPGYTYFVYCLPDAPHLDFLAAPCFVMWPIPPLPLPAKRTLWEQVLLPVYARRDHLDVLFCPAYTTPILVNYRTVTAIHDAIYAQRQNHLPPKETWAPRIFSWLAARVSDRIIAVSEFSKRQIVHDYGIPANRIDVIYEASDPSFSPVRDQDKMSAMKERYGLQGEFVLYVGQILQRRHVPCLLQTFRSLRQHFQAIQLVLVGKNRTYPFVDIQALIKEMGLQDTVVWKENVPDEDLVLLYNAAEVLVYVSSQEGFGLPVLEAMACGCPVITSSTSSLPEVAGDAALQVTPGDVDELTEAIRQVLTDRSLRERLAKKGLHRAAQFSWRRTAEQTLKVLESVVKG
jgi:glycosyltransferase involved in cell wall biosynthesis